MGSNALPQVCFACRTAKQLAPHQFTPVQNVVEDDLVQVFEELLRIVLEISRLGSLAHCLAGR